MEMCLKKSTWPRPVAPRPRRGKAATATSRQAHNWCCLGHISWGQERHGLQECTDMFRACAAFGSSRIEGRDAVGSSGFGVSLNSLKDFTRGRVKRVRSISPVTNQNRLEDPNQNHALD